MACFRKFQQTSSITHKVFIAVEVFLPCLFTQDLLMMTCMAKRVPQAQRHYFSLLGCRRQAVEGRHCFHAENPHCVSIAFPKYVKFSLLFFKVSSNLEFATSVWTCDKMPVCRFVCRYIGTA